MSPEPNIYCMCENWNNQTMWAHYANASNGICLELNYRIVDPLGQRLNAPSAVTYRDVPQQFSVLEVMNMLQAVTFHLSGKKGSRDFVGNSLRKFTSTLYLTKQTKYSFEQEWRSVSPSDGPGLLRIPGLSIKSVLLGTNCSDVLASTLYGRFGKTVKFERIVQLPNSYELSREPYIN